MATDREIGERLQLARRTAGFVSAAEAARALNMVYSTYAGHENGHRGLRKNLENYARRFGVNLDWLLTGKGRGPDQKSMLGPAIERPAGKVPLLGRVGAGQVVTPLEDSDPDQWADEPPNMPGAFAVEVSGDSMFPAFENGTLLYYSRTLPAEYLVNRRAVVQLADGSMLVKVLRRGATEGLWTLQSVNSQYPDMPDQVVEWAAPIEWTKPRQ